MPRGLGKICAACPQMRACVRHMFGVAIERRAIRSYCVLKVLQRLTNPTLPAARAKRIAHIFWVHRKKTPGLFLERANMAETRAGHSF